MFFTPFNLKKEPGIQEKDVMMRLGGQSSITRIKKNSFALNKYSWSFTK